MHEVYPKPVKFRLFRRIYNKLVLHTEFASLEEFLETVNRTWVDYYIDHKGGRWPRDPFEESRDWGWRSYVLMDFEGNIYTSEYLKNFLPKRRKYRCGYFGAKYGNWHARRIKTSNERRWFDADDEDYVIKKRSKRRKHIEPDPWGDYPWGRSRDGNNNWKEFRRHQWKDKDA